MTGYVLRLFVKPARGLPMREVESVSAVAGQGLKGDASFGHPGRHVLLVDQAILAKFDLEPGQTRENIVLAGLSLIGLEAGTRLRVGEAILEVTGGGTTCGLMDTIRPGLREAIRGQRGLLAVVIAGGTIRVGDLATMDATTHGEAGEDSTPS
jgi:MOSC domain-containing protein YiiM